MIMTFLQAVILDCLQKINSERTIYSIYHLLAGKKSSQTIQDAHLFQLDHLFKTQPNLKRHQFDTYIDDLKKESFIHFIEEPQKCEVTDKGRKAIILFLSVLQCPRYIHGWKYQDASVQLWKRLTLLVQAASHLIHSVNRYYPVQRDPEVFIWIKQFFKHYQGRRSALTGNLFKELHSIFAIRIP